MAILFDSTNRLFTLQTNHSMYQMKADRYGVLLHTWFGMKGSAFDYSYRIAYADRGFSGNPYDAGDDRTYSLDALPQEFPTYGSGDYRSTALKVRYPDGTSACELRYLKHELQEGKYSLPGLPALYDDSKPSQCQTDTLIVTLEDTRHMFYVHLYYGVMEDLDIITRAVCVENHSGNDIYLENLQSVCIDYLYGGYDLHTFHGRHVKERNCQRTPVRHGIQSVGSTRGTSSHQYNPFLILSDHNATEEDGGCYGFSLLYSGDFIGSAELDQYDQTRLLLGIHPDNFCFCVKPKERFYSPEAAMAYSEHGLGQLSRTFHNAYRNHLCRGKWTSQRRPVLLNDWEGVYFDFDGDKLIQMAKDAAELGVELFVMDDGWFGKRDLDVSGLGDWIVNEKKLGCTLKELSDEIHNLGLQFGIWFEPEGINEDSDLYRAHPEWAMQVPGKPPTRSRQQLLLDFSREEVRDYIFSHICQVLDSARIEYLKWDLNRSLCDLYSAVLPSERQGEVMHRYVLGLYDMLEKLIQRYPDMLIEGCSGGGGRFDAGMLYYTPQIWCSDNTDAADRVRIQYGTSFFYPAAAVGAHVSAVPNHQTGRGISLKTRGVVAMAGTFGYELDPGKLTEGEKETVKEQIRQYKKYADLIRTGDYYRLSNPFQDDCGAWMFVSEDGVRALVNVVMLENHGNMTVSYVKLKGLNPDGVYRETISGKTYYGSALMKAGIPVPVEMGEYRAYQWEFVVC